MERGRHLMGPSKSQKSQLQALLDQVVDESDNIHNGVLLVEMPGFKWKGASGLANPDEGLAMEPDDQFFTASVAKMMTATLVMKLAEAGQIGLDDRISGFLAESVTEGLHEHEGRSYGDAITIRQCLNHTTGLADNWDGRFIRLLMDDPDKLWEPEETIEYVKLNLPPHFPPGQGFKYSDINYNLVGLAIEKVTGEPLHVAYRARILDPLGMDCTYRQYREQPRASIPGRAPSHVFYDEIDYASWRALSADWAGGGLQTTTEDLNRFLRAFAANEVFDKPSTREEMFEWVSAGLDASDGAEWLYGLGIIRVVSEGAELGEIWGHQGASSCFMYYWPEKDATFCGTFNQNRCEDKFIELLPLIAGIIH
jgi:CubicO group peptidase (beta-lactamase class C family)